MQVETNVSGNDAVLQRLQAEHRRYSEQLESLAQNSYPSAEEQMEEARLKKLKLRIKDEIAGNRLAYRFN